MVIVVMSMVIMMIATVMLMAIYINSWAGYFWNFA
jgi:hypothetical protein